MSELLIDLLQWLKDLGYKAPEVIEQDRHDFISRIEEVVSDGTSPIGDSNVSV